MSDRSGFDGRRHTFSVTSTSRKKNMSEKDPLVAKLDKETPIWLQRLITLGGFCVDTTYCCKGRVLCRIVIIVYMLADCICNFLTLQSSPYCFYFDAFVALLQWNSLCTYIAALYCIDNDFIGALVKAINFKKNNKILENNNEQNKKKI